MYYFSSTLYNRRVTRFTTSTCYDPYILFYRTLYASARDEQFPEVLSYVNCKRYTPVPCLIFTVS